MKPEVAEKAAIEMEEGDASFKGEVKDLVVKDRAVEESEVKDLVVEEPELEPTTEPEGPEPDIGYERDELEAMTMKELRVIGESYDAKGRAKEDLIAAILTAQS